MSRVLLVVISVILMVYCVVEVAQAEPFSVRRMPRWAWVVVIVCFPVIGAVAWLALGRPNRSSRGGPGSPKQTAPDDDPDFLRGL